MATPLDPRRAPNADSAEAIARNLLLSSHIFDAIPIDQFRKLFPPQFQDSAAVASLHRAYTRQRRQVAAQVDGNISDFFFKPEGSNENESEIQRLEKREEKLHQQLRALDEEIAEKRTALEEFADRLEKVDFSQLKVLANADFADAVEDLKEFVGAGPT